MKTKYLLFVCLLTAVAAMSASAKSKTSASPAASAAASPAASASASPAAKGPRPIPFHGMISAVDQKAKTFTIAGKTSSRVFKVTDKTVVTKGGATATMSDIAENQEVAGSYWKQSDGSLEAKTVKVGPKVEAKAAASPASAAAKKKP